MAPPSVANRNQANIPGSPDSNALAQAPGPAVQPKLTGAPAFIRDLKAGLDAIPRPPQGQVRGSVTADQAETFVAGLVKSASVQLGVKFDPKDSTTTQVGRINQELSKRGYALVIEITPGADRKTRGHLEIDVLKLSDERGEFQTSRLKGLVDIKLPETVPYRFVSQHLLAYGDQTGSVTAGANSAAR